MRTKAFVVGALLAHGLSVEVGAVEPRPRQQAAPRSDRAERPAGMTDEEFVLWYRETNFPGCIEQMEGSQAAARARAIIERYTPSRVRPRPEAGRANQ